MLRRAINLPGAQFSCSTFRCGSGMMCGVSGGSLNLRVPCHSPFFHLDVSGYDYPFIMESLLATTKRNDLGGRKRSVSHAHYT